jgi:hypothetical protein
MPFIAGIEYLIMNRAHSAWRDTAFVHAALIFTGEVLQVKFLGKPQEITLSC